MRPDATHEKVLRLKNDLLLITGILEINYFVRSVFL